MTTKIPDWERDIRADYASIIPPEQIDATVEYWRDVISRTEQAAREDERRRVIEDLTEHFSNVGRLKEPLELFRVINIIRGYLPTKPTV